MSIYKFDSISKSIYHQILAAIENKEKEVRLSSIVPADYFLNLYKKAISESNCGYLYQPCSIRTISSFLNQTIYFDFCAESYEYIKTASAVEFELEMIIQKAKKLRTKYDVIKAVHGYFVSNFTYAHTHMNDMWYASALSVFLYRESVCEGFALAYALVMNKLNIPCGIILGKSTFNEQFCDHAWNIVQLGNHYYHIDVTWDICTKEGSQDKGYDYFLLDDKVARLDHWWNDSSIPLCSDPSQEFYFRIGSCCNNIDECISTITQQLKRKKKVIFFRCISADKTSIVNSDMIPNLLHFAASSINVPISGFTYSFNSDIGTVRYQLNLE